MQGIKKLAGLANSLNGPHERAWLRTVLVILSFFGVVAASFLNGTPIDANTVSDLVRTLLETALASRRMRGTQSLRSASMQRPRKISGTKGALLIVALLFAMFLYIRSSDRFERLAEAEQVSSAASANPTSVQ